MHHGKIITLTLDNLVRIRNKFWQDQHMLALRQMMMEHGCMVAFRIGHIFDAKNGNSKQIFHSVKPNLVTKQTAKLKGKSSEHH